MTPSQYRRISLLLTVSVREQEKAEADSFWKKSQWAELENYILNTLDSGQRAKLKLKSPLGVAQNLLTKYKGTLVFVLFQETSYLFGFV